jgi:uroporphyrinogen decarboxylase
LDFAPSVYEHAARIIGRRPWEVSRDPELMFQGHAEAYRRYGHRPVVVGIDIYNLEAEACGAPVRDPGGNGLPAVSDHPCADLDCVAAIRLPDPRRDGRLPMVLDVGCRLAAEFPTADVRIPVSGPFSIAASLLGLDRLLMGVVQEPQRTRAALRHLVDGQVALCAEARRRGLDIAFFESASAPPLLSPAMFHDVELPPLREVMVRAAQVVGHAVPCIIGGNTTPILDDILSTGTGYVICPAEADQRAFMRRIWDRAEVTVRINTSPEVVATGDVGQIRAEVDRILALVAGRPNVCLGTGALPYETSPESVVWIRNYVAGLDAVSVPRAPRPRDFDDGNGTGRQFR